MRGVWEGMAGDKPMPRLLLIGGLLHTRATPNPSRARITDANCDVATYTVVLVPPHRLAVKGCDTFKFVSSLWITSVLDDHHCRSFANTASVVVVVLEANVAPHMCSKPMPGSHDTVRFCRCINPCTSITAYASTGV